MSDYKKEELYTPEERARVKLQNRWSLPRWMRRVFEPRENSTEHEEARRRRQIASGFLGPQNRGTTMIGGEGE